MKKVLGLDLGTNSIGWALIEQDFENKKGSILGMGSRIIPMSQDILGNFGKGNSISQTAERTNYRGIRRLRERHLLRRERLHRVLNILGFLPEHYASKIDFEKRFGQFLEGTEPKLAYNEEGFIFKKSFNEMLEDFKKHQPDLLNRKNKKGEDVKVPYDWTLYFLRKKAISQKIEKEELAWIILNFNQKRGYYQLRGEEEEEKPNQLVEFHSLKITDVKADEETNKKGETWYSLTLENGWIYRRPSKTDLANWKDKVRDFIVTTDIHDDGSVKTDEEGKKKRSFRSPKEDDWTLIKKKTEQDIGQSQKTVGTYIYENLLQNPKQKIKGKLVRTIEREFYKEELKSILKKQIELQPELFSGKLYTDCIQELYKNNESQKSSLEKRDFVHLFLNDIIFYHRPLKSQKSSIGNCSLEYRVYKDEDGNNQKRYLKSIPKSNPYYQEFRVWQWLYNLKIYRKEDDTDVTEEFIKKVEDIEKLFEFLMSKKEVDHKAILKHLGLNKAEIAKYRWNYVYDSEKDNSKKYPMNETGYEIRSRLKKFENIPSNFLTQKIEQHLWHIIYSVTDKVEYEKSLKSFAKKYSLDEASEASFVENFKNFKPFKSDYGRYSEKAIKKLLPLMRKGKYWNWDTIDGKTKTRINKIITAEYDEKIKDSLREKAISLSEKEHFQGLPLRLAERIVYGETNNVEKWASVDDLKAYLKEFKQHSLRNPIVEQVVMETLRVVKDIWEQYGNGAKDYFNEIHVELGRDMKNPAEERKRLTDTISKNEETNLRIKIILAELMNDGSVENVRPHSPMQQEILKIYEDGVLNSGIDIRKDIVEISKKSEPTKSDVEKYKLWLDQKYISPYTGKPIPLSRLFTDDYEKEHIIPQSRYFDDSFSNKVICEAAVNRLKDNQLGLEFIKKHQGEEVSLGNGENVKISSEEDYKKFVKENYAKSRSKRNKLMLEEIPEKMIARQLNDTRYISKFVSKILSNIVRSKQSDEGVNSKNLIPFNGKITARLKQDWGMNDVWNELILPRFERMNELTKTNVFTSYNEKHQKSLPTVPLEISKGFDKKRIDHRHHALDALIIACATRNHVNLLNNEHAKSDQQRFDLNRKLRKYEMKVYNDSKTENRIEREIPKDFRKPWSNFTVDAKNELEKIVVTFKQNLRVINKATNKYQKWVADKNGEKKKELVEQKGTNWAIRKPMHKETFSGEVDLPRVKLKKGEKLIASRKSLDPSFTLTKIKSITDTGIQKILKNYLSKLAFSPEGIEDMNKNIAEYNNGKPHQPILKVRVFEKSSKRFQVGSKGNKSSKYVEAAKGTNLFFAIYRNSENKKRSYDTIPLNIVIESQKQGLPSVPQTNEKGDNLLFHLSPNDLVYVPTEEEINNPGLVDFHNLTKKQIHRIYKFVSSSGKQGFFIPFTVSNLIFKKKQKEKQFNYIINEYSLNNELSKNEKSIDGIMIKEFCIKLKVDRLGNISKI